MDSERVSTSTAPERSMRVDQLARAFICIGSVGIVNAQRCSMMEVSNGRTWTPKYLK